MHQAWIRMGLRRSGTEIRLIGEFAAGDAPREVPDPYGAERGAYEACAAQLTACMPGVVAHLRSRLTREKA